MFLLCLRRKRIGCLALLHLIYTQIYSLVWISAQHIYVWFGFISSSEPITIPSEINGNIYEMTHEQLLSSHAVFEDYSV